MAGMFTAMPGVPSQPRQGIHAKQQDQNIRTASSGPSYTSYAHISQKAESLN
jgi:hypothetical protein